MIHHIWYMIYLNREYGLPWVRDFWGCALVKRGGFWSLKRNWGTSTKRWREQALCFLTLISPSSRFYRTSLTQFRPFWRPNLLASTGCLGTSEPCLWFHLTHLHIAVSSRSIVSPDMNLVFCCQCWSQLIQPTVRGPLKMGTLLLSSMRAGLLQVLLLCIQIYLPLQFWAVLHPHKIWFQLGRWDSVWLINIQRSTIR